MFFPLASVAIKSRRYRAYFHRTTIQSQSSSWIAATAFGLLFVAPLLPPFGVSIHLTCATRRSSAFILTSYLADASFIEVIKILRLTKISDDTPLLNNRFSHDRYFAIYMSTVRLLLTQGGILLFAELAFHIQATRLP